MSIAKVIEISCTSRRSFEDAVQSGVRRVSQTVRNVTGAWVKEQQVRVVGGKVVDYRVNMLVTFIVGDDEMREDAAKAPKARKAGKKGRR